MLSIFPSSAPWAADAVAVIELGMAVALLAGKFVVRRGRIRLHLYLQSTVVLANLPVILWWMLPRFASEVLPGLPGEFLAWFYLVPTVAGALGGVAEALGVYILLVAGTTFLPERWRFRNYKRWMRFELVLWWAVVVLGLLIFATWYLWPAPS